MGRIRGGRIMSEYLYYEFQTIDRPLSEQEQREVDALSSHIDVTPRQAVVTYNYSDFKHDPKKVLVKYFDAMLYTADWGTRRLMFRFPKALVSLKDMAPFYLDEGVDMETIGDHVVLDIWYEEESGYEDEALTLSPFLRLRDDLLHGDYRTLYLGWLQAATRDDIELTEEELEPPVPPGLGELHTALAEFRRVFGVDPHLLEAAAQASPPLRVQPIGELEQAIARLPRSFCDNLLARLLHGEAHLDLALRRELATFVPRMAVSMPPRRTLGQLMDEAERLRDAAKRRQAREAERKRLLKLQDLAQNEERIWQEVEELLQGYSAYDEACQRLVQLDELATFQGAQEAFRRRVASLCQRYARRSSFIQRLKKLKLYDEGKV
jgi:hypothetical protein